MKRLALFLLFGMMPLGAPMPMPFSTKLFPK